MKQISGRNTRVPGAPQEGAASTSTTSLSVRSSCEKLDDHLVTLAGLTSLLAMLLAQGDGGWTNEAEFVALSDATEFYAAEAQKLAAGVWSAYCGEMQVAA